jgi:nitrogenase molybdenum-iron protein alpha/beta subunit
MGNKISTTSTISFNLYNFEKVQNAIKNNDIIINTLSENQQKCLIAGTTNIKDEVTILNQYLKNKKDALIVIYGKNSNDNTVLSKYDQLIGLGFNNVAIYLGGIFEWLLLQDIYGYDNFPTTSKEIDILKYK